MNTRSLLAGAALTFLACAGCAGSKINMSTAPNVPVQIAHLTGSGGYDAVTDSALGLFADAIARNDTRMKNVWFDAAVVVRPDMAADMLLQIAARIRQIGVQRVPGGRPA